MSESTPELNDPNAAVSDPSAPVTPEPAPQVTEQPAAVETPAQDTETTVVASRVQCEPGGVQYCDDYETHAANLIGGTVASKVVTPPSGN